VKGRRRRYPWDGPGPRSRLLTLAGAWLAWRWFGPEPILRSEGQQIRPEGPPGRSIVVGRHEFFVRESGPIDAPKVLLLHGWLYDSHMTWHRVTPLLAERHRVITVDLRNHGKSDRIRGRFEVAELADDVARLLDSLGVGPVPVVGYSLGGMVAQELALRSPARVTSLVLAATAARPVAVPRWISVPLFVLLRAVSRIDRFLLPRLAHGYLRRSGAVPQDHAAWLWRSLLDRDLDLYWAAGFAILRFDALARLGGIRVPTTCVITPNDQLVWVDRQRETANAIPGATVVELAGGRHEAVFTHADEIAKVIVEAADRLV